MTSQNPIAGGPDFMVALKNALEKAEGYKLPPPTGGTQISVRFSDDRLAILEAVARESGWNRNQVINAFVDRGLFEIFHYIADEIGDRIMTQASERLIPTYNPLATVMKDITSYNRFRIFPSPQVIREGRPALPIEGSWAIQLADRERNTVTFTEASPAGYGLPPLHMSHVEKLWPDTAEDATNGMKNAMLQLNVQVVLTNQGPRLIPMTQPPLIRRDKR